MEKTKFTIEYAKHLADIFNAYANGEIIQWYCKGAKIGWVDFLPNKHNMNVILSHKTELRIKPY